MITLPGFAETLMILILGRAGANSHQMSEADLLTGLVEIRDMTPPAVSPDGKLVAFGVVQANVATNAYSSSWCVVPTDGSSPARTIWSGGDLRVQDRFSSYGRPTWSSDGHRFVAPVTEGDEASLIVHDVTTGQTEQTGAVFGTVEEFAFVAKDQLVVTIGPRPPRLHQFTSYPRTGGVRVPHGGEARNVSLGIPWFTEPISASGSFATQAVLVTLGEPGSTAIAEDEAATLLAQHHLAGALSPFMVPAVYDPLTPRWKEGVAERFPGLEDAAAFGLSHDGLAAAYVVHDGDRGRLLIAEQRSIRPLDEVERGGQVQIIWSPKGDIVHLMTNSPAGWRLRRYARSGNALGDVRGPGQITVAAGVDAQGRLIARWSNTDTPGDLVAIDTLGNLQRLTSLNPHFAEHMAAPPRLIEARDRYGRPVQARAYLPPNCRRCPVVVHIYGSDGFPRGGNGDEWPFLALLRRGIAVIDADPPLDEADYSNQGTAEGQRKYVDGPVSGAIALIDVLAAEGLVDRDRAGIVGLSFGAMVASWGALKTDRFAASSSAGIDLYFATQGYVNGWLDDFLVEAIRRGDGSAVMEYLGMNAAPHLRTAMLSHEPEEEYRMFLPFIGMLRAFGRPVEQFVYANEGHTKTQPSNRLEIYRRNLQWFDFWLADREDQDPAYADQYARWRQLRLERDGLSGQIRTTQWRD